MEICVFIYVSIFIGVAKVWFTHILVFSALYIAVSIRCIVILIVFTRIKK